MQTETQNPYAVAIEPGEGMSRGDAQELAERLVIAFPDTSAMAVPRDTRRRDLAGLYRVEIYDELGWLMAIFSSLAWGNAVIGANELFLQHERQ